MAGGRTSRDAPAAGRAQQKNRGVASACHPNGGCERSRPHSTLRVDIRCARKSIGPIIRTAAAPAAKKRSWLAPTGALCQGTQMQTVRETAQAPTGVIAGDTSSLSASQLIVDSKQISFACEGPPYNFYTVRCRQEDPTMVENANRFLDALGPFIERLDAAGDLDCNDRLDALKNIFSDAVTALGFKYFTYHVVRARAIDPAAGRLPHIISTYPDAWVRHYFREQYLDEDPVLGELMRRHSPFIWAEIARPDNLSHRQRRLFDEAQDAGIINGVTFPLHNGSEIASISLIP